MRSLSIRSLDWSIWLQATIIAPRNATEKHPKKTSGETGIDFRETIKATSAAQNGDRFNIAAVMIGCALERPILYNSKPHTPVASRTANLIRLPKLDKSA